MGLLVVHGRALLKLFLGTQKRREISEDKCVGEFLSQVCFLRAQGSGKVQHCLPFCWKMNDYHLSLNNSEVIYKPLNGVKQSLRNSLLRTFCCFYSCKTSSTIYREVVAKVGYFRVLGIRRLKRNMFKGLPCGSADKESTCSAGDLGLIPGLGRPPGEGKGYPLKYSGLENSMDYIVHGVMKSRTWLSDFHFKVKKGKSDIKGCIKEPLHSKCNQSSGFQQSSGGIHPVMQHSSLSFLKLLS